MEFCATHGLQVFEHSDRLKGGSGSVDVRPQTDTCAARRRYRCILMTSIPGGCLQKRNNIRLCNLQLTPLNTYEPKNFEIDLYVQRTTKYYSTFPLFSSIASFEHSTVTFFDLIISKSSASFKCTRKVIARCVHPANDSKFALKRHPQLSRFTRWPSHLA